MELLLTKTGEVGEFIRSHDWTQTPLGAIDNWSAELKTAVQILAAELDAAKTNLNQPKSIGSPVESKYDLRYRALFNSIDHGFSVCELYFSDRGQEAIDYRFIEVNSAFEAIAGLKSVKGKLVSELIPSLENFWLETYAHVVLTGESVRVEHQVSGLEDRWFAVNAFPIEAPQKHRFGILFTDISDRKSNEQKYRQNQERLEIALAAGDVGAWDLDLVTSQSWRSLQHDQIFGYGQLLPNWSYENFLEHVIPEDRIRVDRDFQTAIATQTAWEIECGIHKADGELGWIWTKATTEYSDRGQPLRMYGVVKDITNSKRQELNTNFLAEIQKDLVVLVDADQIMSVVGEKMRCFFGFSILTFADIDVESDRAKTVYSVRDRDMSLADTIHQLSDYFSKTHLDRLKSGQVVAIKDVSTDPDIKDGGAAYQPYEVCSLISAPHLTEGQWKFLLAGSRAQPSKWRTDEIELIDELTSRIYLRIERARAEAALQKINRRFESAMQAIDGIVFECSPNGENIYRSEGLLQLLGIHAKDALPTRQWWQERIHGDDLTSMNSSITTAQSNGDRYQQEYRIRHADGRWIDVWERGYLQRNLQGEIVGVIGFIADISDRKYAERKLRESEERLSLTIESTNMGTWDLDLTSGKVLWSEQNFRLFGYEPTPTGEATDQMWNDRLHPDDQVRVNQLWQESLEQHTQFRSEHRIIRFDNQQTLWIQVLGSFVYDYHGLAVLSTGIIFDISDRKYLEEALYFSRERLNLVIDSSDLGLWYCDLPFDQLEWNDTCKAHFGLSPDTQVTMDLFYECVHFSDRDRVKAKITESIANHQKYDIDYRTVAADGKVRWIRSMGRVFYDPTGKPIRFDGVTMDMTNQKEVEQELYHSEARYRHLAESIPQLVWISDMQGGNEYVNQQMCEYTGLDFNQLMGLDWKVIIHPDDWDRTNELWMNAVHQSTLYEIEYRLRSADGSYRWHLGRAIPVKDQQGNTVRLFGTATDMEEQKQLAQKLAQTIEQVQERNQELDQFAHIVSHDLKAPLRAIANLAEWIEDDLVDILPADSKAQMQLLRGRVYRMNTLLSGILEFAKIGRAEMKVETVSVPALLAEIVDTLLPPSSFQVQIDPDLPTLQTQSLLLRQVFTNLIDNAIKHHHDPSGWVKVSSQDLGDYYEFAIADNGKGIEPESQEKIFTIFQTLESKDHKDSTGVGLAIVKKIVTTIGGKIYVKSIPNQGSTFYFTWLKSTPP